MPGNAASASLTGHIPAARGFGRKGSSSHALPWASAAADKIQRHGPALPAIGALPDQEGWQAGASAFNGRWVPER